MTPERIDELNREFAARRAEVFGRYGDVAAFCARHNLNEEELRTYLMRGEPTALHYLARHGVGELLEGMADPMPAPAPKAPTPEPPAVAPVDRIRAILQAPEAKGRETAARHLALETALPVADAVALLRTMPHAASAPAPAPRTQARDTKPTEALVSVYPPAARLSPPEPKASWGNVLAKMNGGKG